MTTISIKPKKLTPAVLKMLQKKGLVKTFTPSKKLMAKKGPAIDLFYATDIKYGSHKLICVKKGDVDIELNWHTDNEDVIAINPLDIKYKPMYFIVSLHKKDRFKALVKQRKLKSKDILALEVEFNNPKVCVFTVLKGAVHCEVTKKGRGADPVFFVTEPTNLVMETADMKDIKIELKY